MTKPVVVTGCGRSGTHWIGRILTRILGPRAAKFEPVNFTDAETVVVDSRLRFDVEALERAGHRVIHLVRDGRDVVRSLDQWYRDNGWTRRDNDVRVLDGLAGKAVPFESLCVEWAHAIELMGGCEPLRIEDLSLPGERNKTDNYTLPHWTEWDAKMTETFWWSCGDHMKRMGY